MKLLQRGTIAALLVTLSIATEFGFEELYNADTVEKLHEGIERKFRLGVDDFDSYRYTTLIRSLGMVAYYARLRRRFGRSQNGTYFGKAVKIPKKDSKEYDKVYRIRKYPAVPGQLNKRLLHLCSVNFITCVTRIENTVIQRYKPMYSGGKLRGLVRHFQRLPTEMILYDTTVSYMFCFFAHNKLLPMKALPYCNHGPAGTANGLTGVFNHRVMYGGEDRAYQCAIESFCPDPCCGLERDREGMGPGVHTMRIATIATDRFVTRTTQAADASLSQR
ncbi:hypothetical protein L596_018112 [Steinernema carpocapsae]|uniref:Uncharacterized protein n=1 Tax=Steinernema carpocapsae TaxID=34508 RepID=A0A4U5N4E8_STECR|nr:hypothetical protein L596_018112 [Steinernema carpocapsae]